METNSVKTLKMVHIKKKNHKSDEWTPDTVGKEGPFTLLQTQSLTLWFGFSQKPPCIYMSVCCISQMLCFLPIAGSWQPTAEQIFWCHFSNPIPSLCVSVSHLDNSHHVLNIFTIVIFVC